MDSHRDVRDLAILKKDAKISPANDSSISVRVTIPAGITEIMNLSKGDTVTWVFDTSTPEYVKLFKKVEEENEK